MHSNYFLGTLGRTKLVLSFVLILAAMVLFSSNKAHAFLVPDPGQPPSPSPPAIPTSIYVPMNECYLTANAATATTYPAWISMIGDPAQDTGPRAPVVAGTPYIDLDLNIAMASCMEAFNTGNQWLMIVRDYFNGVSSTVPAGGSVITHPILSPPRNYGDANVGMAGRAMGAYNRGTLPLRYSPGPGGFTSSGLYTINLDTSSIIALYNGNTGALSYLCGGQIAFLPRTGLDDNPTQCQNHPLKFQFWVDVQLVPDSTVSGRLVNAANVSQGFGNITIETCVSALQPAGSRPRTDANGYYSFTIPQGTPFCIRADSWPAGATIAGDRPFGEGYWTCPAYSAATSSPNYCTTQSTYEFQVAGGFVNQPVLPGLTGAPANIDRAADGGYDIAFVIPPPTAPVVSCSSPVFGEQEYGVAAPLSTAVKNDTPASGAPSITISATYSVPAGVSLSGAVTYNPSNVISRGGGTATASQTATFPAPGSYSVTANVSYSDGVNPAGSISCPATIIVYAKPYLKTFGADVSAGGVFKPSGSACSAAPTSGGVYAFTKSGTNNSGASSQFGVLALLSVKQFYSSARRIAPGTNIPPKGTTFANTTGAGDATYGGGFAGPGTCITDYYLDTQDSSLPSSAFAGAFVANGGRRRYTMGANSTIGTLTVPVGAQAAIYIDGNVFINGTGISFAGLPAAPNTRSQMPNFALIVRGNIYISPSVTRLDGLYVAQPDADPTTSGKIYTCASALNVLYAANQVASTCNTKLTVNGAFIAKQIKFYRTLGTVNSSTTSEAPSSATAAEVINFTPEMYMAPTALTDPNSTVSGSPYDSIFSLPPVF